MKSERQIDWERLKTIALSLGLLGVEETTSRGEPTLKAHGQLWVWWSPHEDAPVFKVPFEEREILVEAEPSTFFVTTHYKGHPLVSGRFGMRGAPKPSNGEIGYQEKSMG
jgi:hypothetical protein